MLLRRWAVIAPLRSLAVLPVRFHEPLDKSAADGIVGEPAAAAAALGRRIASRAAPCRRRAAKVGRVWSASSSAKE